jgi:mRNA-degrading endonuclease RelE of RelBE toxin-antitoxin system
MPYRVRVTETAKRDSGRLPGHVRQRVRRLIDALTHDPTPSRARELRGLSRRYRLPVLRWRIIYRVDHETATVLVLTVRQKEGPETYQNIKP